MSLQNGYFASSVFALVSAGMLLYKKYKEIASLGVLNLESACGSATTDGLVVATRIHTSSASNIAEVQKVAAFVVSALKYASKVIVCIGFNSSQSNTADTVKDMSSYIEYLNRLNDHLFCNDHSIDKDRVVLLPIYPWGKFTTSLNCAILKAIDLKYEYIAFQSLEFRIPEANVSQLFNCIAFNENVAVVGPAMQGHSYEYGNQILRGRTCPWNTFAIWSIKYVGKIGFPMIGDGSPTEGISGGVEEVTTVALLQKLYPNTIALLFKMENMEWQTNFTDPKRKAWHDEKMTSKDTRPDKQLHALGLPNAYVRHL
jgi:hypothetical protein